MCVCVCVFYCGFQFKKKFGSPTSIILRQQRGTHVLHKALGTQFSLDVPTLKPHYICSSEPTGLKRHAHWQPALPQKTGGRTQPPTSCSWG